MKNNGSSTTSERGCYSFTLNTVATIVEIEPRFITLQQLYEWPESTTIWKPAFIFTFLMQPHGIVC